MEQTAPKFSGLKQQQKMFYAYKSEIGQRLDRNRPSLFHLASAGVTRQLGTAIVWKIAHAHGWHLGWGNSNG